VPFPKDVPWKADDIRLDDVPKNMFRNGVRRLPANVYRRIIELAGRIYLVEAVRLLKSDVVPKCKC
jgi:hypothetical protein